MTAVEEPAQYVRSDGREKVTGSGRYTADLTLTGQLHAAFRYADHPHAGSFASTPRGPGRCRECSP